MSKTTRLYKIFMASVVAVIAGLLLASGIIAIQKSIKIKMDIEFLPGVNVEIYVKNDDNPTEKLIFSNYAQGENGIYVDSTYCTLSATTLTFNNNFVTAYKNNFTLVVINYSNFTIETNITSTNTAKVDGNTVDAVMPEITPSTAQIAASASQEFVVTCEPVVPQETIISMQFGELFVPPYTIYQYGDTANGAVAAPEAGYNGYKYIEFTQVKEWTNDEDYTVPLRWVIIGTGENQKDLLPSEAANKSANPDNLGADEILVISEQCIEYNAYDTTSNIANWSTSDIRSRIKSYTEAGGFMASLKQYMVPKALTTAWYDTNDDITTNATTASDPDYMFLLAHNYTENPTYATQDFLIENYLGTAGGDLYKARYVGYSNKLDYWWLRSGFCDNSFYAYLVYSGGNVGYDSVGSYNYAVRPSFILNLA